MWVKELLSEQKPTWTFYAHDIIARTGLSSERNVNRDMKMNIFLQSFNTKKSQLPRDLQRILTVANETGVRAEENHNLRLVGEVEEISQFLDDPSHNTMEENLGCKKPNECMLHAKELMDTLPKKWDPRFMLPEDYEEGPEQLDEGFEFDRRVTVDGSIANAFRIFTEGVVCNELPDLRLSAPSDEIINAATDGSCIDNGSSNARASENSLEIALKIPTSLPQSNQVGKVVATKELANRESAPSDDSQSPQQKTDYHHDMGKGAQRTPRKHYG
ncbi:uncharacterized protein EV420DRAFT_1618992 [Desarmillaria tabescens]|uniref:Uncharacterized protein n=1 Tax=Armillaria tabescens TaxID=1929756 RepID=A0AA39NCR0_ARMTA|nr:uncharacterized protein EV420DRAFT_1618992 [Desarmillaria tabescens]KAK0463246.1 hypothetical protein EV420DRAFT_1618992 [Desarmillaria tabescens]